MLINDMKRMIKMSHTEKKVLHWINCGKFLAITCVLIDHTAGVFYSNINIAKFSCFSVSLFILLSGITSFYSNRRNAAKRRLKESWRRLSILLIPYAVATAVYQLFERKSFDLSTYLLNLLNFNADGMFYFVFFFAQLTIISPFLYDVICAANRSKRPRVAHALILLTLVGLIPFLTRFTFMLPLYGAGKYLFGGFFLLLYYLGMLFASLDISFKNKKSQIVTAVVSFTLSAALFLYFMFFGYLPSVPLPLQMEFTGTSVSFGIFAGLVGLFVFSFVSLLEQYNHPLIKKTIRVFSRLGKYSYYIFLYHWLVCKAVEDVAARAGISNIWVRRGIGFPAMLLLPCLLKWLYDVIRQRYISSRAAGCSL